MQRKLQSRHFNLFAQCVNAARERTFDKGFNKFETFNSCLASELAKTNPEFKIEKWLAVTGFNLNKNLGALPLTRASRITKEGD